MSNEQLKTYREYVNIIISKNRHVPGISNIYKNSLNHHLLKWNNFGLTNTILLGGWKCFSCKNFNHPSLHNCTLCNRDKNKGKWQCDSCFNLVSITSPKCPNCPLYQQRFELTPEEIHEYKEGYPIPKKYRNITKCKFGPKRCKYAERCIYSHEMYSFSNIGVSPNLFSWRCNLCMNYNNEQKYNCTLCHTHKNDALWECLICNYLSPLHSLACNGCNNVSIRLRKNFDLKETVPVIKEITPVLEEKKDVKCKECNYWYSENLIFCGMCGIEKGKTKEREYDKDCSICSEKTKSSVFCENKHKTCPDCFIKMDAKKCPICRESLCLSHISTMNMQHITYLKNELQSALERRDLVDIGYCYINLKNFKKLIDS